MIGWLSKTIGQIVGEAAHQTGEGLSAIADIPTTFMEGFNEELFECSEKDEVKAKSAAKVKLSQEEEMNELRAKLAFLEKVNGSTPKAEDA